MVNLNGGLGFVNASPQATVQSDGKPHFVEEIQTLDGAKERVRELGKLWRGKYVIEDAETGERVFVSMRDETKN